MVCNLRDRSTLLGKYQLLRMTKNEKWLDKKYGASMHIQR